jgi:dihydrofolate reductase
LGRALLTCDGDMSTELRNPSHSSGNGATPNRPRISLLVAVADNGAIGKGNQLPWHLPADLQRFKTLTLGKPIIMGRKTYESIGRPLPGRHNIVLSRSSTFAPNGVTVVTDLSAALRAAGQVPEVCIVGGAALYREALPLADVVHRTRVHTSVDGDAFFEPLSNEWRIVSTESRAADERHVYAMTFEVLERAR